MIETENMIRCELCNEDYDRNIIRLYEYPNNEGIITKYFICEDCVIHHKKNSWNLGEELN